MVDPMTIADAADVIIDGYAVIRKEDGRTAVVNLNREGHAAVILPTGEVDESSMDEIELVIALDYLKRAEQYLEEDYAQVL